MNHIELTARLNDIKNRLQKENSKEAFSDAETIDKAIEFIDDTRVMKKNLLKKKIEEFGDYIPGKNWGIDLAINEINRILGLDEIAEKKQRIIQKTGAKTAICQQT